MPERSLLVVSHPGHELRLYGWLTRARPLVLVLTDGSGRSGAPRLDATREVLEETGARAGAVFGAWSDIAIYRAMLDGDAGPLCEAVDEIAATIRGESVARVVCDAAEGYNPTHDLCRGLAASALRAAQRAGCAAEGFDFPLVAAPDACAPELRPRALAFELDDALFARKLAASRRCADLGVDVAEAIARHGESAFRRELLRPFVQDVGDGQPDATPYYETRGEQQVAAGKYARVLRRREHVLPLLETLGKHAERA